LGEVAKPHHAVPDFYLRGFADDAERITTVRLPGDGQYTRVVVKPVSEVEANAASVLRSIEGGTWPLSEEQRGTLAAFMVVQYLGGPDDRPTMRSVQSAEEIMPYVLGRPWKLFRFQRRSLVTSDSPVALVAAPDDEPSREVGFQTAWTITFPLNRRLGLVMGDMTPLTEAKVPVERVRAGELDVVERGTTVMQMFINEGTVQSASEYVYHHPHDADALPPPPG
jgi:hypothetical protein